MNIELDEVVVQDVSDDALELAAGGAKGGIGNCILSYQYTGVCLLASAAPVTHLEFAMNIELDEVVVQDVSDDALELAAGGAQGGDVADR
jgi:hypothetical protein